MGNVSRPMPDLSMYVPLIDDFLARRLAEKEFVSEYMRRFKNDQRMLDDQWFDVLNDIFLDSDEYVDEPRLRTGDQFEIDEHQLRERVQASRHKLRGLGAG